MTMYLTKTWGFSEPCGPLQFGTAGWRDKAREMLRAGDLVLIVGTKGSQTDESERGRLLGLMEPTKQPVLWTDFDLQPREIDFNSDGEYRWQFGLLNKSAWKFTDRPMLDAVSDREFNMDAAAGIVPLTEPEERIVLALHRQPIALLQTLQTAIRVDGEDVAKKRASPPPQTKRNGVMHMRRAPAHTYVMKIEHASTLSFKVGWAFDYRTRQRQFNSAALPQLGGLKYSTTFQELWPTARLAFEMEQTLLKRFDSARHRSNHEVLTGVDENQLFHAWMAARKSVRERYQT